MNIKDREVRDPDKPRRPWHRYDAVVVNYHDGIGPSATTEWSRRPCVTLIGADYARRFVCRYGPAMSFLAGNVTSVTRPGQLDSIGIPESYERIWRPVYWLRDRWDGLRYGRDRDARW
jgi:hypothetical protein